MCPHACACLQSLSTERKAVLCSFSSQVLSGAQQTVGADEKKNAARNLHQRKYNVFLILCPWRAKGPTPQLVRAAPRRIWSQGQQRARRRFKLCFINRTDTALPGTAVWEEILMGVEI